MVNIAKLNELIKATASSVGYGFVNKADADPMTAHNPPLIIVNTAVVNPANADEVAAKVTDAGKAYAASQGATKPAGAVASSFPIVSGFVRPAAKRRGNAAGAGAPSKYPFADLNLGQSFFVANSEVEKGDAFKTLGATVSSANRRFSEETGEVKTVERAKRDEKNKAILDGAGNKVMETVQQKVRKSVKHFTIAKIEKGVKYGDWVASDDGAMISRDL